MEIGYLRAEHVAQHRFSETAVIRQDDKRIFCLTCSVYLVSEAAMSHVRKSRQWS